MYRVGENTNQFHGALDNNKQQHIHINTDRVFPNCEGRAKILPSKLPNKIHSGQAAWLLALALLYKTHAEIPVDTKRIENEAKSIHMLLETFIANNFPDALLNKDFACDFDRSIHYGFMITKASFIKFIKKTASLCSCLASKQSKQKTLDRQQSDQVEGVSMYPHIRDLNILIRADQLITDDFYLQLKPSCPCRKDTNHLRIGA